MTDHSAQEAFDARYEVDDSGCWLWTGHIMNAGYGMLGHRGRRVLAHRISHELHIGPIPEGMVIDHKCRTRRCVNPDHLHAVTRKQNSEHLAPRPSKSGVRGVNWDSWTGRWAAGVRHNYKRYNLGRFDTVEEAEAAVIAKRNELFTNSLMDHV